MTSFRAALSMCWNTSVLTSLFSTTASTTKSASSTAVFNSRVVFILAFASFSSLFVIVPASTNVSRALSINCSPFVICDSFRSCIITLQPPKACTIARACPISPAPITPTFSISLILFSPLTTTK